MDSPFNPGDRVYVDDPALAQMRELMRQATGSEPTPNHQGTVQGDWDDDDSVLITFDDGGGAPYPIHQVHHLDPREDPQSRPSRG